MSIPTQTEMFLEVLRIMSDGRSRTRKQVKDEVRVALKLSKEECDEKTSSGVRVYESRAGWAVSYLSRAEMLNRVSKGVYCITEYGLQCLQRQLGAEDFVREMQLKIARDNPWGTTESISFKKQEEESSGAGEQFDSGIEVETRSPQEVIDEVFSEVEEDLKSSILSSILSKDPAFFEQLVVDLLVKMGYGKGYRTQMTNDAGIDGIIATDALGFDPIYVQAKRYEPKKSVGRPELQAFAGALGSISRGAFITTSSFAKNAIEWADHYPHATLVLIDGQKLANLMIQYDLGVTTERVYKMKRLDNDYFSEE